MDYDDYDRRGPQERQGDDVYSKPVRAGKRTYFFDVKSTKGNDYYLTITESKRRVEDNGRYVYDKHKIFLYKEDFEKFSEGLQDVVNYIHEHCTFPECNGENVVRQSEDTVQPEEGPSVDTANEEEAKPAPSDDAKFSNVNFDEL